MVNGQHPDCPSGSRAEMWGKMMQLERDLGALTAVDPGRARRARKQAKLALIDLFVWGLVRALSRASPACATSRLLAPVSFCLFV